MSVADVLEAVMLICFGWAWPIAIAKTLRVKKVHGQSPVFLMFVFVGYASGLVAKFVRAGGGWPSWVAILYTVNAIMVAVAIVLYYRFHEPEAEHAVTLKPEPPVAEAIEEEQRSR